MRSQADPGHPPRVLRAAADAGFCGSAMKYLLTQTRGIVMRAAGLGRGRVALDMEEFAFWRAARLGKREGEGCGLEAGSTMTFVLVHGGAHGAWCWERMTPYLSGTVVALDLPGRGSSPAPVEAITLSDWVDAVVEAISGIASERVVLVGHSLAGMVLPRVAERIPEKLERMIFVSCSVPPEGRSVIEILSPQTRLLAEQNLGNRIASVVPEEVSLSMFCNDMDSEQTRFVLDRLVPEAWSPMLEPSRLAGLQRGVPATYVKLLQDAAVSPALQDEIIALFSAVDVVELDAGHDAMISQPEALARLINEIAGR